MGYSKEDMRFLLLTLALLACSCGSAPQAEVAIPTYGYEIVHTYPHDRSAFTEGLIYENGFLYESTGQEMQSSLRKVKLETGEVVKKFAWPEGYFGEGIIKWHDKIYQLTYKNQVGFIFDANTFVKKGEFNYQGQGWALTTDGNQLYMDGSRSISAEQSDAELRVIDPDTLNEIGTINVTARGVPVKNLNELEWVKNEIYANIWQTYKIARIEPKTGNVVGWIDLSGILGPDDREGALEMNGIAYDAAKDRLFVTGKNWSKLFEIKVVLPR